MGVRELGELLLLLLEMVKFLRIIVERIMRAATSKVHAASLFLLSPIHFWTEEFAGYRTTRLFFIATATEETHQSRAMARAACSMPLLVKETNSGPYR